MGDGGPVCWDVCEDRIGAPGSVGVLCAQALAHVVTNEYLATSPDWLPYGMRIKREGRNQFTPA